MQLFRLARRSAPILVAAAIAAGCNDATSTDPARSNPSDNSNALRLGSSRFATSTTKARYVTVRIDSSKITIPNRAQAIAIAEDASSRKLTGKTPVWESTNPKVAQVSQDGVVTPVSAGTAWIAANIDGQSGSAQITVLAASTTPATLASIKVGVDSESFSVGGRRPATATLTDSKGSTMTGTVTWSSSNTSVATVSSSGLITGVAAGSATIKATSGTVSGSVTVKVVAVAPTVASIAVSLDSAKITAPNKTQGKAILLDSKGAIISGSVTWSSSNTAVATVDANGLVTGVAAGSTVIKATNGSVSGSVSLSVQAPVSSPAPVASVAVALAQASVVAGGTTTATATTKDASNNVLTGRTITWSSSNTAVATVASNGAVTAKAAGTANIVATSEGKTGQATLTVTSAAPAAVASVAVTLAQASLTVGGTTTAAATLRDAASNVLTGRTITWSSSNTAVATVASNGAVTAKAAGTASIVATSEGKTGQATVTVTAVVTPPPPAGVNIIFQDGFEGGNLGARQNGVSWISNSYVDVSSAIARSGSRAARFNQGASKEWSELRFGGLPNINEAYIQYYLYMPSGNESPNVGPKVRVLGGANDKFFRLWGGDYNASPGNKVGASTWGNGTDGSLGLEYEYTPSSGAQWGMGQGPSGQLASFVNDRNRGRWVQIRIRAKTATAANNDGILQMWVDGQLLLSMTNMANYPGSGAKNYTEGYLLGWANNGFAAGQVMYVDDFTISTGGFPN